jgi:hypothetical protein
MDRELEEQIGELINKATKDLKMRIVRIVVKHQNRLLKEQAREFKTNGGVTAPRRGRNVKVDTTTASHSKRKSSKKDDKYNSDSDSDGYYE